MKTALISLLSILNFRSVRVVPLRNVSRFEYVYLTLISLLSILLTLPCFSQVPTTCKDAYVEAGIYYSEGTKDLYTGNLTCYYGSGAKESEGKVIEGKKEGLWISYWDGTKKKDEINYVTGLAHGPFVTYFKGGEISSKGSYLKGYLNGPHESYYLNGKTERRCTYVNGLLEGKIYSYTPNGVLVQEQTFENGEEEGPQYTFNDQGKKITEIGYKDGDEFKHGKYAIWNDQGVQTYSGYYILGKKTGTWKAWYDNGTLSSVCRYDKNGNLKGTRITYFRNGNTETKARYMHNELHGKYAAFYENGKPKSKGLYKEGRQAGEWTEWDEQGNATKKLH